MSRGERQNISDEQEVNERRKRVNLSNAVVKAAVVQLMDTVGGRLFVSTVCGLFDEETRDTFHPDPHVSAHQQGYRDHGEETLGLIQELAPRSYAQMVAERLEAIANNKILNEGDDNDE